jgi:hypothetical protein
LIKKNEKREKEEKKGATKLGWDFVRFSTSAFHRSETPPSRSCEILGLNALSFP